MDGEDHAANQAQVDRHLRSCAQCRAWEVHVLALQRRLRQASAHDLDDRTASIVAAVHADTVRRRLAGHPRAVRACLALVATAQLMFCLPVLVFGQDHAAPEHVAHELGAFSVGIALGFALAALWPRLASGMVPIAGIIASLLLITAGTDLATGATEVSDELPHLLELAGFLLLLRVAHFASGGGGRVPLLMPLRQLRGERPQPC